MHQPLSLGKSVSLVSVSLLLGLVNLVLSLMSGFIIMHLSLLPSMQTRLLLGCLMGFVFGVSLLSYYHERKIQWLQAEQGLEALTNSGVHLLSLSPTDLSEVSSGTLMQQLSNQLSGLFTCLAAVPELIYLSFTLLGMMTFFLWVSLAQFMIVLPMLGLSLGVKYYFMKKRLGLNQLQMQEQARFTTWLTELIHSMVKIRSSAMGSTTYRRGMGFISTLKSYVMSLTQYQMTLTAWDMIFTLALTLLVMQKANFLWLPLLLMVSQISPVLDRLTFALMRYQQGRQSVSHIEPVLQLPREITAHKMQTIPEAAVLSFHNVSYQPPGANYPLISDINFTVNPGEFLALTGASGSGKSTILRLALGLIQPTTGKITLNGIELHHYDMPAWRRAVGSVLQTSQLMNGSIYRNIAANTGITLQEAWTLAEVVGFDDDIRAMPMGMQTLISEHAGESLSGGQRQKCLLARALAQNPRWLFLDEATSQLDNHSEARVQAYLAKANITRLVVAHRESSVRHADRCLRFNSLTGLVEVPGFRALNSYSTPPGQIVLN